MNRDLPHTRSTCCYCGTGCGVIIHSSGGQIVGVEGDKVDAFHRCDSVRKMLK